jgi:hypothetical protein
MSGRMVRVAAIEVVAIGAMTVATLTAQSRKEYHYNVGPKAVVSVNNPYGAISVKPSSGNTVNIIAVLRSDKVEVDNGQNGNHIEIQSHLLAGADVDSGRVDYEITVPGDASVALHSSTGPLHAEKLHGDVTLEGAGATVDVRDISDAHVHVKTLNGPVTLTNVQDGHVEVDSLSGDVTLDRVTVPPDQPQRRHRSHGSRKYFRRCERSLRAGRSSRRRSSPAQNALLVPDRGGTCLHRYYGSRVSIIYGGAAQLQW